MADHYSTLGVDRNASQDEIKRAYRKLAAQHHPDRGGDTAKFQEIQGAYATLSDSEKKAQYDNPQPQGMHFTHGGVPPGFEDIFSQMFGGGGNPFFGHGFRQPQQPQRNRTLNLQTTVSLEEAYIGKDLMASITLPSGRDQLIEIKIPAGVQDGTVLRLAQMGDDSVSSIPRGDLHLTVNVAPHRVFQRQGDDLLYNLDVNCIDAILGKNLEITTLDGKVLELTIKPGTQHGQILGASGYGMPKMSDNRFKGRLLINIQIKIPSVTDDQKQILKEHFQ